MLQNLTKGKMVEWVVLLVALVALGLSIASVTKSCKSDFAATCTGPDCKVAGQSCQSFRDCGTQDQQINCYCNEVGPSSCKPKGYYCQNNKECCNNAKCINNVCGDCAGDTEACNQGKPCCQGFHCSDDGICIDSSGSPPLVDPLCKTATNAKTEQECLPPCHWDSVFKRCLQNKLPSGKSPPSHRDECEEKHGDECMLDGEHPYYSCCKNEKIYDKDNNFKKYGKPLHCKRSDDPGLPGFRCLYPNEGKKGLIGGGGSGLRPISTSGQGSAPPSPPSLNPDFPKFGPGGQDSHQEHDGGGKKSNNLPLILGLSGGALVIVLAIVFLLIKKSKIKLK